MRLVYLFILAIILTVVAPAHAADITYINPTSGDPGGILIKGEIQPGDEERFRSISLRLPSAIVMLESDGGTLMPALEIGRIIRVAGYDTTIRQRKTCASACALIWLAGISREVKEGGRVGFHAAYRDNQGKLEEVGSANALIGSYLTSLGLPTKAVLFATSAPPDVILWLTEENSTASGIDFAQGGAAAVPNQIRPATASPSYSPARLAEHPQPVRPTNDSLIASLSLSGEIWTKIDGFKNLFYEKNSAHLPRKGWMKLWVLYDYSAQSGVGALYEMKFAEVKCEAGGLRFTRVLLGYVDGSTKETYGQGYHEPAPGTQARALVVRLCRIK
ncbi:MAG: hypothetical protein ACO1OX_05270 [Novosphingobium sp.]